MPLGIITFEDILEGTFFLILSLQTKHLADSKMLPQNSSVKKSTMNSIWKTVKHPMSLPRSITSTKTTYTASISTPPSSARKNRLHRSYPQTPLNMLLILPNTPKHWLLTLPGIAILPQHNHRVLIQSTTHLPTRRRKR